MRCYVDVLLCFCMVSYVFIMLYCVWCGLYMCWIRKNCFVLKDHSCVAGVAFLVGTLPQHQGLSRIPIFSFTVGPIWVLATRPPKGPTVASDVGTPTFNYGHIQEPIRVPIESLIWSFSVGSSQNEVVDYWHSQSYRFQGGVLCSMTCTCFPEEIGFRSIVTCGVDSLSKLMHTLCLWP